MQPPDHFEFVNKVVEEAIDLPTAQRETAVRERCGSADHLVSEALALLALSNSADGFLDASPTTRSQLRSGDVLGGRFQIRHELGTGGGGTTFLAEDQYLGEVALKVLQPSTPGGAPDIGSIVREVRAGRSVRHRNVCPVFDLFTLQHERCGLVVAFTMKYLNGETLASRLSQGKLSAAEAMRIARGIASGVNALHAEGIVHCDLKPGNIMLDTTSVGAATPVIVDFGLATRATAGPAKAVSGSPQYMAPEQFRLAPVSPAVDVYAFGLILFEMLAGKRPFPAEELLPAAIRRAVEAAPRLRSLAPWAPIAWDEAITLALSRVPSERPRSAGEVIDMMTRAASPAASIHMLRPERSCIHSGRRGRARRSLTT